MTVVYWGGLHPEAGLIIRQMADQGVKASSSRATVISNELASIAGPAVEGTLNFTFGPDRACLNNADLVKKFRDAGFGHKPTLYSYAAAVQSLARAAKAAGSNDPQEIAKALKEKGPVQDRAQRPVL